MKIVWTLLSLALICTHLIGCENEDEYKDPGLQEVLRGPAVVYGPVEKITRTGSLNIGKAESDGYYAFGEFITGNEAYYVVIRRAVLLKAQIKFDREGRYLGKHTVVITSQDTVSLEPDYPDIYEIKSIKTP